MTKAQEMLDLAERFDLGASNPVAADLYRRQRNMIASALRLAAQPQSPSDTNMQGAVQYRRKDGGYGPRWITMAMFDGTLAAESYYAQQRKGDECPFEYRVIDGLFATGKDTMSNWKSLDSAPKDGTWLKVRGWDFGVPGNKRHYAIAFFENADWHEVGSGGSLLYYLTDWQFLSPQDLETDNG